MTTNDVDTPVSSLFDFIPYSGDVRYSLEDYQSNTPRWCPGCGDSGILTALQRLCRDEQLAPEKTVFVSGIGCASRFPHYMKTYGFHGLHGRALPIAQGIKIFRPDLNVFVNTGDGDCCSIGTAHWIHAIRHNMDLTVIMHDNQIYGLTKMQFSPTSPRGLKSNTSPRGTWLQPLNPLTVTLGVSNVSFVAQAADWIPQLCFDIIEKAFHHRGFSFIRVLQRCPNYLPKLFEPWIQDPNRTQLLVHDDGIQPDPDVSRIYENQLEHDPGDIHAARKIASNTDLVSVGILYQNDDVPCYEDTRRPPRMFTAAEVKAKLDSEFARFTVEPTG
jgi:2-oxoglutarate ferredoxin oxidoreductase subunit beta